jgi:cytochrome c peroxidase
MHSSNSRRALAAAAIVLSASFAACGGEFSADGTRTVKQRAMGGTVTNGTAQGLGNAFLFEPEFPLASLKTAPTWDELEQLLDDPYNIALCSSTATGLMGNTPGNEQNYPSVCTKPSFRRRPTFGVTLPPLLVHPLNYNPATGEQMRLLNIDYPGGPFDINNVLGGAPNIVEISPGAGRVEEDEAAIDYNSPLVRDTYTCITSTETPEGVQLCGGDPGEPEGYSTAAAPGPLGPLFDAARGGVIKARHAGTGVGGLRKPSLRIPEAGGKPNKPNYVANAASALAQDPAALTQSNENDYVRSRAKAIALGKALFWDMQVGSDGVQSCGTCHFNAGADNRTKNILNPNHLGGDTTFQVKQPNQELVAADFPFHKLKDPEVAGDPLCATPIKASINAGVLENNFPGGVTDHVVCDAANAITSKNDVASSMGVKFGAFKDVPPIGTFVVSTTGVGVLPADLRSDDLAANRDPIDGFAGTDGSGHQIRRVEPRNTPTLFGASSNFDNFWDGRARHDFNGGSPFGASDPQAHVFVFEAGKIVPTRQVIRFVSLASLATGPALSEFEMSFLGRNWPKIGKKLLQGTRTPSATSVTPLANQLVDPTDSALGPLSNQGGSMCIALARPTAVGKPGLCTTYREMIEEAFYPALWQGDGKHLDGCYNATGRTPTCPASTPIDPVDGYVLTPANGAPAAANTNQFSVMEANMSLFFGLSIHLWTTVLVPDDTPLDKFLDTNPDAFRSLGEPGEPGLVPNLPMCATATARNCMRESGPFKRDTAFGGSRTPDMPDPLLGMDIFQGSNFSLKNTNFRSARCGECHAGPSLSDHTMPFTHKAQLLDFIAEFKPGEPGVEQPIEPLGRVRVITGFLLESEMNENGQDAIERRIINQSIAPNPVDGLAYPDGVFNPSNGFKGTGSAFFDNGIYNLGVTPIANDPGRGDNDPWGWPLSIAALQLKNAGGHAGAPCSDAAHCSTEPGFPLTNFDPSRAPSGGLFPPTSQDQQINPGDDGELITPLLPPHLGPWVNNIHVGDAHPDIDEVSSALNTLTDVATIEGFIDVLGPFNPAGVLNEALNSTTGENEGTWPNVNRVGRMGSFKAPQLRGVELTGPYFHNGGKLTLRQVVDFYVRGGDFPITNAGHRDFNIVNQNIEVQSNLTEAEKVALVDFLLTLTDERVRFDRAPFDHPEVFVPLDGLAPENNFGRPGFLANIGNGMFLQSKAVGASGNTQPARAFLDLDTTRLVGAAAFCGANITSQYCH